MYTSNKMEGTLTRSGVCVLVLQFLPLMVLLLHAAFYEVPYSCSAANAVKTGGVSYFDWKIKYANMARLCTSKRMMTVNGQFPGPSQYVYEGDKVVVSVTNMVDDDITIHWHGVRQLLSCWSDGVAYITQCPIKPNETYVYRFSIVDQRGTLLWHGHKSWQRATLYGAFIILPRVNVHPPYPFQIQPQELDPLILGEWWNTDVEQVVREALASGGNHIPSDALTINGQPGLLYNCSEREAVVYEVRYGETYLLRVINAAVNIQMYFAIANHTLTVVEADAEYTEPLESEVVVLAPGQTLGILLHAKNSAGDAHHFLIAASAFSENLDFPATPTTAILSYRRLLQPNHDHRRTTTTTTTTTMKEEDSLTSISDVRPQLNMSHHHGVEMLWYDGSGDMARAHHPVLLLPMPVFPAHNDSDFVYRFYREGLVRSRYILSRASYYMDVPEEVEESFLYTLGYGILPCPSNTTCFGPFGAKMATFLNNNSFTPPPSYISLLQAYYYHLRGVYETDFPDFPPMKYNFTGEMPRNIQTSFGTRVRVLPFNCTVQVVFQNTKTLFQEGHPLHLHGQNFWVVGMGLGNFNPFKDPIDFNLRNPISRNTVVVPSGGWAAIRFRTLNPGVWFLHCHLDIHQSWGMSMAFIVLNGQNKEAVLPSPPHDLPKCT